jgi:transposase, IS30 family
MGYRHLSIDEREIILKMRENSKKIDEIAEKLGRSKATVSRELRRNVSSTGEYKAHLAQKYYSQRRAKSKQPYRLQDKKLLNYVLDKLIQHWSPEQISGRLIAKNKHVSLCAGTIYRYIRDDKDKGGSLYRHLRHGLKKRRKRYGGSDNRGQILNKRIIDDRPAYVEKRNTIGHWESDSMVGRNHKSYIATHVERKSRYLVAVKLDSKSATDYNRATVDKFRNSPVGKIKTMTVDNGKEFADFKTLEKELNTKVYFAHPYCSCQRGTNENTNGLLRQYFPKGTDFNLISQKEIDKVVNILNNRPRKCLGYRTPAEVLL